MTTEKTTPPKWLLIVSALFAAMELAVSVQLFVAPQSVMETVDFSATGVVYLSQMWAARQFALGFIFAFASMKRSVPMLTLAYVFLLVMFLGDLSIAVLQKETALMISALVMCGVASALIYVLTKLPKKI
jgi:hypothetical protein